VSQSVALAIEVGDFEWQSNLCFYELDLAFFANLPLQTALAQQQAVLHEVTRRKQRGAVMYAQIWSGTPMIAMR
jgi:hypothetical protein